MMDACRILVVEDDSDINALLCRILSGAGYRVDSAFSGTEAQLRLQMEEYDLLLLDLMLPGLAGEELIAWLRAEKMMPVIVLSAKAGLDARVNALRLGADDFIQKPFEMKRCSPGWRRSSGGAGCFRLRSSLTGCISGG